MIVEHLHEGDNFSDLSETYVIFMSEHDTVGNGRAVNSFSFRNDDLFKGSEEIEKNIIPHASLGGRTHILHINGDFKDESSEIGKLIHDFKCKKADEMYFPNLAARTRELKETKEGVETMCQIMEKERVKTSEENTLVNMLNLMDSTGWDAEKAMTMLKIPAADRELYARSAARARAQQITPFPTAN